MVAFGNSSGLCTIGVIRFATSLSLILDWLKVGLTLKRDPWTSSAYMQPGQADRERISVNDGIITWQFETTLTGSALTPSNVFLTFSTATSSKIKVRVRQG